jgi:hypothetical protein
MALSDHIRDCLSFLICANDDKDELLNKFIALYTTSIVYDSHSPWLAKASEAIDYMNNLRILRDEEDLRLGLKLIFNDTEI